MANLTPAHIVLAGGRSRRLGGVAKSGLLFEGRSLLGHALAAGHGCCHRVVVGPDGLVASGDATVVREDVTVVGEDVTVVREDPPFGGPVAGIDAGFTELEHQGCTAEWILVTACDHPRAEAAAAALLAAALPATRDDGDGIDLIAPVDATGHVQNLFALYRRHALRNALAAVGGGHNLSVRRLVAGLATRTPRLPDGLLDDVDDLAAAARLGITVPSVGSGSETVTG